MSLQWIVVVLLVTACAVFSTWRLLALRLRFALLERAATVLPARLVASRGFTRLRASVQAQMSGGCGACAANTAQPRLRR